MKYYAVIDTNDLVSALLKLHSVPGTIAIEALIGDIIPVLNEEILAEYEDVLNRPKFRFNADKVRTLLEDFPARMYIVTPREMLDIIESDRNL